MELEAESKAHRTWTPVLQVPEETVAIATFQWRRVPLTRPVIIRLLAVAAAIIVLCGAFAYGVSSMGAKAYGSRSEIQYTLTSQIASGDFLRQDRTLSTQLVAIKSRTVLDPVAQKYHMTVDALSKKVVASILAASEVIRIEVDDPSQAKANKIVGDITDEYLKYANTAVDTSANVEKYWNDQLKSLRTQRNGLIGQISAATPNSAQQQQLQAELTDVNSQITDAQTQLNTATLTQLQTQNVRPLTLPYDVGKVAPKPLRAGLAGALAGMMIAAGVVVLLIRRRLKQMPLDQFG